MILCENLSASGLRNSGLPKNEKKKQSGNVGFDRRNSAEIRFNISIEAAARLSQNLNPIGQVAWEKSESVENGLRFFFARLDVFISNIPCLRSSVEVLRTSTDD